MHMLEERTDTVLDSRQLLAALNSFKRGDFSVRLDFGENGVARKVADAFNEALELNEQLVGELERISQVVGKAGRLPLPIRRLGALPLHDGGRPAQEHEPANQRQHRTTDSNLHLMPSEAWRVRDARLDRLGIEPIDQCLVRRRVVGVFCFAGRRLLRQARQ